MRKVEALNELNEFFGDVIKQQAEAIKTSEEEAEVLRLELVKADVYYCTLLSNLKTYKAQIKELKSGLAENLLLVDIFRTKEKEVQTMNFGQAIELLKQGKKVARTGWNGIGMFLYYVPADEYIALTDIASATFGEKVPYSEYIALKTVDNKVVPWVASQTDILAEDWVEII